MELSPSQHMAAALLSSSTVYNSAGMRMWSLKAGYAVIQSRAARITARGGRWSIPRSTKFTPGAVTVAGPDFR